MKERRVDKRHLSLSLPTHEEEEEKVKKRGSRGIKSTRGGGGRSIKTREQVTTRRDCEGKKCPREREEYTHNLIVTATQTRQHQTMRYRWKIDLGIERRSPMTTEGGRGGRKREDGQGEGNKNPKTKHKSSSLCCWRLLLPNTSE